MVYDLWLGPTVLCTGLCPPVGMASIWKPVMVSALVRHCRVMLVSVTPLTRIFRGEPTSGREQHGYNNNKKKPQAMEPVTLRQFLPGCHTG
eukprot:g15326.t1